MNNGLFALSSNADKGAFWAAIVLGIALTGSNGRTAARRGALTLIASSTLANLVAKKVVRAPQPKLRGLRHRHLNHTPTSPSFSSGHTATAAALATGVWVANPKRGLIIAALALAAGFSRLHVGAHWFSDVATGTSSASRLACSAGNFSPDSFINVTVGGRGVGRELFAPGRSSLGRRSPRPVIPRAGMHEQFSSAGN
ncbi:phosphatase PAP2 family protein [Frondihabitans sp. VKM Ac-2883]|uniref:phosphatase PAP2 family protein n=1 Tax=Frondihabitans sp. VKM Ac-2883 TaxID=2783823 RepID=UPI00188AFE93|nr:phosphatase PAP2 family protein [Frondihabitans sp. VKM Ac-2883]